MSVRRYLRSTMVLAASLLAAGQAGAVETSLTGFASLTEGKVLSGNADNAFLGDTYHCPCALANYEYAGVYESGHWSAAPDSILGVQANVKFNDVLSGVLQVDGRDQQGLKGSVDWAYLSYQADGHWTLQGGRKRIPMYLYADSNYVGYSYTWVRPPVDVYGWDVYAYDGINALYKRNMGEWSLITNLWYGNQDSKNNVYWAKLYNQNVTTESNWKSIVGGYIDLANDDQDLRFIYMTNKIAVTAYTAPGVPLTDGMDGSTYRQRVMGLAYTADWGNWQWRSEVNVVKRSAPWAAPTALSWLAGVGYRMGQVTGMLTYSRYWENTSDTYTAPQRDDTRTATLRWDFRPNWALKFQYDYTRDHSPSDAGEGGFFGDSRLATVSLVTTF